MSAVAIATPILYMMKISDHIRLALRSFRAWCRRHIGSTARFEPRPDGNKQMLPEQRLFAFLDLRVS